MRVDASGLTLLLRRAPRQPPHVIWLDATERATVHETLFGRPVTVVRPQLRFRGRVRQVWAGLNNKQALAASAKPTTCASRLRAFSARLLRPAIHWLKI